MNLSQDCFLHTTEASVLNALQDYSACVTYVLQYSQNGKGF